MKKKIVIISNYYPPEMGAAANRIRNLALALKNNGNDVIVLCPLPNYPEGIIFKGYKKKIFKKEFIEGIIVKRFWIYPSKSKNKTIRLFSMFSFAFSLWFSAFSFVRKKPNLFIIQSPPLIVSFSGLLLSKFLNVKNILNVSDIWPLSALELGVLKKGRLYDFLEKIEYKNYKMANRIIGQSDEIICHIQKKVNKEVLVYRNVPYFKEYAIKKRGGVKLKIVYAGLLGYAQGILNICNNINFRELGVEFHIYGSGMEEDAIKKVVNSNFSNVFFHGKRSSEEIKNEIIKYDIGLVPLKNRIYGAVPSKIFELAQLGIPILFFGEGEGAKIVENEKIGYSCSSNTFKDLEKTIIKFKKLDEKNYEHLSTNALNIHKKNYNLEFQFKKITNQKFLN